MGFNDGIDCEIKRCNARSTTYIWGLRWCYGTIRTTESLKGYTGESVFNSEQLHLNQIQLATVLGVEVAAITQLQNQPELDLSSKQGKLALLLIRLY